MEPDEWLVNEDRTVSARLTEKDLLVIHCAVRQLRASEDDWEFQTLVGATTDEADRVIARADEALRLIGPDRA
jgi:hypothetical protein